MFNNSYYVITLMFNMPCCPIVIATVKGLSTDYVTSTNEKTSCVYLYIYV